MATTSMLSGSLLGFLYSDPDRASKVLSRLNHNLTVNHTKYALQTLLAIGVLRSAWSYLDVITQNAGKLRADKKSWKWSNELAVVTGGSGGIGAATTESLVKLGCRVIVHDVVPLSPKLEALNNVHYIKVDISDPEAVTAAAKKIESEFGRVSILVNNAGIGTAKAILDRTPEYLTKIFAINVISHYYTVQAFLPGMLAANHGHIVSVASIASFVTAPGLSDYCASKAGVLSFHECLKQEIRHKYKKDGVLTTVVHPGWVRTGLTKEHEADIAKRSGALLPPEALGTAIVDQIKSCRGAQLVVPSRLRWLSLLKGFPHWMQETMRSIASREAVKKI